MEALRGDVIMAGPTVPQEFLKAENTGLRLLLEQAGIDAQALLAQAGIDAEHRETSDNLQKLILEELHHRIKNTLATVSAIASQSLRTATSIEHGQHAIESRLLALGRAHDLLLQARWSSANLAHIVQGATEPYDSGGEGKFSIEGPDLRITSGAARSEFFSAISQLSVSTPTSRCVTMQLRCSCTNSIGSSIVMMWPWLFSLR